VAHTDSGFGEAGQHGRLGQTQVFHMLAKIFLGCGFHSIGAVAQIDVVQVEIEHLFFTEKVIYPVGQNGFPQFAGKTLLGGQKNTFDHLLGDGAASLNNLASFEIFEESPANPH